MINNAQDHINQIRREKYWLDENGHLREVNPLVADLQDSIMHLSEGLYSSDAHFIFELIQNAEDNVYQADQPSLSLTLTKTDPTGTKNSNGALIFQNNETGFSIENVNAICAVGKSTKSKFQGYIGEKGIGFKSVFRITSMPHILSNGYRFSLPEYDLETKLGFIVPTWIEKNIEGIDPNQTTIILPLDKTEFNYEKIEAMLRDIEPETILFLSKLRKLTVTTETGDDIAIIKDDSKNPLIQVSVEGKRAGKSVSEIYEFLVYPKRFSVPQNITHEKRSRITVREVTIAYPLNNENQSAGKVFAYLPITLNSGLPLLINADFTLTSSRESVQKDQPWNQWLAGCVAKLTGETLEGLKGHNHLDIGFLEKLSKGVLNLNEKDLLYPIFNEVCNAFKNKELLPADDGAFIKSQSAKLDRSSDLRKLLNQDQLTSLFRLPYVVKWLSADITETLAPNLILLLKKLDVEEVRPEKFVSLLTDDFLEKQDDTWIVTFYVFFKNKEDLWEKPTAPLRKRKIIRLEDNSHVVPFSNGKPNAYLPTENSSESQTIKKSIFFNQASTEFLKEFLKKLGIRERDLFTEVTEFILPKYGLPRYGQSEILISFEENISDLRKIFNLLNTEIRLEEQKQTGTNLNIEDESDRVAKLSILLEKLGPSDRLYEAVKDVSVLSILPFILSLFQLVKASNGLITKYWPPQNTYLNSPELRHYFEGNSQAWLVADEYPERDKLFFSLFLKVNEDPKGPSIGEGKIEIPKKAGDILYKQGLSGYDPNVKIDGLEHALTTLTHQKSAFIWNKIALKYASCIRGIIEESFRKNSKERWQKHDVSAFGNLLMESAWLPNSAGSFSKPREITLSDLPTDFEKDTPQAKSLSLALGMKQPEHEHALDVVTEGDADLKMLIEHYKSATDEERKKLLKIIPHEATSEPALPFKEVLKNLGRSQRDSVTHEDREEKPPVSDGDRYQDNLNDKVEEGVQDHNSTPHTIKFSPIKVNPSNTEARNFLYEEYFGCCQITGTTFPKAAKNTEGIAQNYFEACGLAPRGKADYLNDAGNMLCVSADTMAKLKHASFKFLDDMEDVIRMFKETAENTKSVSVKILLAGEECSITWSQRHFMRLVALYEKA